MRQGIKTMADESLSNELISMVRVVNKSFTLRLTIHGLGGRSQSPLMNVRASEIIHYPILEISLTEIH